MGWESVTKCRPLLHFEAELSTLLPILRAATFRFHCLRHGAQQIHVIDMRHAGFVMDMEYLPSQEDEKSPCQGPNRRIHFTYARGIAIDSFVGRCWLQFMAV